MSNLAKYTINYKDKAAFDRLKQLGEVTYYSRVLNFLFLISSVDYSIIKNTEGVLSVKKDYYR